MAGSIEVGQPGARCRVRRVFMATGAQAAGRHRYANFNLQLPAGGKTGYRSSRPRERYRAGRPTRAAAGSRYGACISIGATSIRDAQAIVKAGFFDRQIRLQNLDLLADARLRGRFEAHSSRSLSRSIGIDPSTSLRIRLELCAGVERNAAGAALQRLGCARRGASAAFGVSARSSASRHARWRVR